MLILNPNVYTFSLIWQAYCYHGQTLLASDKCGEAIRSLQEAEKCECIPDTGEHREEISVSFLT